MNDFKKFLITIFEWWYCHGCKTHHSRRIERRDSGIGYTDVRHCKKWKSDGAKLVRKKRRDKG